MTGVIGEERFELRQVSIMLVCSQFRVVFRSQPLQEMFKVGKLLLDLLSGFRRSKIPTCTRTNVLVSSLSRSYDLQLTGGNDDSFVGSSDFSLQYHPPKKS